jgi:hypothetical protein
MVLAMTDQGPAPTRTERDAYGHLWEIGWELEGPRWWDPTWRGRVNYRGLPDGYYPGTFLMESPTLSGLTRRHLERRLTNWEATHVFEEHGRGKIYTDGLEAREGGTT